MFDIAPGSFEPAVKVVFSSGQEGDQVQTLWSIFGFLVWFSFLRPMNTFVCDLGVINLSLKTRSPYNRSKMDFSPIIIPESESSLGLRKSTLLDHSQ